MLIKKFLYISVVIIICFTAFCFLSFRTKEQTQFKMGTFVSIRLTSFMWDDFNRAFERAFGAIDMVERSANLYNFESELSRLNRSAHNMPFKPSEELFSIIYNANIIYQQSNGFFDITIAPLAKLWKDSIENKSVPNSTNINQALSIVGSDKVILDKEHGTVFFKKKGIGIDLGAVAKGYAVDKAVKEIKNLNFRSGIINAGGDIYCLGKRYFLFPWRVGIKTPSDKDSICMIEAVSDRAIATSGGYEQFFIFDGERYSHLVNPKTGYPVDAPFSSVTVIADTCFLADALATAIFIGGKEIEGKLKKLYPEITIIVIEKDFDI
jgi:FAD:protein FMN transferase